MSHMECVYATFLSNCAAQKKIMSHMECVYLNVVRKRTYLQ